MKRPSEAAFGKALRQVDLRLHVYRPPDPKSGEGVSNWKPADFLVWVDGGRLIAPGPWCTHSTWFEVKDVDAVDRFAFAELRQSQLAGIRDAKRVGIPYWLAVYWRRHKSWTISDAARILAWRDDQIVEARSDNVTSISRELLMSRFGIQSSPLQLTSTLKAVLLGEVG